MTANCGLNENGVLVKDTGGDAINVIGEIKILAKVQYRRIVCPATVRQFRGLRTLNYSRR